MSIAMDGSDDSAGCSCEVGLTKTQLNFLNDELGKWLRETHLTHRIEDWRQGFHEGVRIAIANILRLTEEEQSD